MLEIISEIQEYFGDTLEGQLQFQDVIANEFREMIPDAYGTHFTLSAEQATDIEALVESPNSYKPHSPITKTLLKQFREYRELHSISAKNIDTQETRIVALSSYLVSTGQELSFHSVSAFVKTIDRSPATQQQFVLAGAAFWKWAMKHSALWREKFKDKQSPFAGHEFPKLKGKAKVDASRKDYSPTEVDTLLRGAMSAKQSVLADLISLGYYTGARIEEICQLRIENLITVDGVLSFDITDSKTEAGIRQVPVHPALQTLVSRLQKQSADGWLLPIQARNKYGKRSDSMSKKFGRLKSSLGFDSSHVFHSLRMTAITQMHRGAVAGPLIAEIVGHETGTETFDTYSQGASSTQKLVAISKIPTV